MARNSSIWVSLAVSKSSKFERRRALAYWLIANKFWTGPSPNWKGRIVPSFTSNDIFEIADKAIERIRRGEIDPIDSANRTIDFLRENNLSSSTIINSRSSLLTFLRYSRLGLDPEDLRLAVKRTRRRSTVLAAKLPTRDEIRGLLLAAPLKVKVLVSMLISTGARIGEARRVKGTDIDFTRNPVYAYFRETKTGPTRIAFLSSETVELLKQYLKVRKYKHEFIFDGYDNQTGSRAKPRDLPLSHTSAWHGINRALRQLELDQRHDGIHYYYHPHTFRLLSLALMKSGGFPPDWAEYLVGHNLGTLAAYLPTSEVLAKEWLKIQNRFCFLTSSGPESSDSLPPTQVSKTVDESHAIEVKYQVGSEQTQTSPSQGNPSPTHRWASSSWLYVKARVESLDYDQALAEGYAIFDSDSSLRILRKRRSYPTES